MKSIVCLEKHNLDLIDVGKPQIDNKKDEVIVKITAVGVCGSDIHAYTGNNPLFQYPKVIGHELCGVVFEISELSNEYKVGDKVAIVPYKYCGQCEACLKGKHNCCYNLSVLGVHEDGGMCEYLKIETKYLVKVPQSMEDKLVAAIEPLSISEHSVSRGYVNEKDILLVVGAGPIGLGAIMMGLTRTDNVIVADINNNRLKFCEEKLGVKTINVTNENFKHSFLNITGGRYATVIIDATGNELSMNNDIHLLCNGGRIVYVGIHKGDIKVNDMDFHKSEATLVASRAAYKEDFLNVIKCIEEGKVDPNLMITHTTTIDNFVNTFTNEWLDKESGLIKGVVTL